MDLVRRASNQAYQLLLSSLVLATFARNRQSGDTSFCFDGDVVLVRASEKKRRISQRGSLGFDSNGFSTIHDLIWDSLVPLSQAEQIGDTAHNFLSTFTPDAKWISETLSIPSPPTSEITIETPGQIPELVFLNFRFPKVHFEWTFADSTFCGLRHTDILSVGEELAGGERKCEFVTRWRALAKECDFHTNPLVATGTIKDTLILNKLGHPLISKRIFLIEHVIQSTLFKPEQLKAESVAPSNSIVKNAFLALSRSQSLITSLTSVSALLASVQPIIARISPLAALIVASIASLVAVSAMVTMGLGMLGKVMESAEAAASFVQKEVDGEEGNGQEVTMEEHEAIRKKREKERELGVGSPARSSSSGEGSTLIQF